MKLVNGSVSGSSSCESLRGSINGALFLTKFAIQFNDEIFQMIVVGGYPD